MWEIVKVKPSTDRHVICREPVIEYSRWEVAVIQVVPAVELCEVEEADEARRAA